MPAANKHIVLGLEGVFMAFGTDSKYFIRTTDAYPSKSAIVGMICAAMGEFNPSESLLDALCGTMEVDGYTNDVMTVYTDMQNMGAGYDESNDPFMAKRSLVRTNTTNVSSRGVEKETKSLSASKISKREYLGDIKYRVVLTLPGKLADTVIAALNNPVHGPFLGRKVCAPTNKVFRSVHTNKADAMNEELFSGWKRFIAVRDGCVDIKLDGNKVPDIQVTNRIVSDVPVSFNRANRKYKSRQITYHVIHM